MKKFLSSPTVAIFVGLMFFNQVLGMVFVDTINRISGGEQHYIQARQDSVNTALLKFVGECTLPVIPRMAVCSSGGGYRAMIANVGFWQALADIGLWDAITYQACLSGSTWFWGSFLMYDSLMNGYLTIQDFRQKLKTRVVGVNFFDPTTLHWDAIIFKLMSIYNATKSIQPADVWGAVLADRLLPDLSTWTWMGQEVNFSNIQKLLEKNPLKYPFPIFTSSLVSELAYHWMEINPYAAGGDMLMNGDRNSYHGVYIPSIYLGSAFNSGQLLNMWPEMTIASLIGICGSPYSLSLWDIVKFVLQQINAHTNSVVVKVFEAALEAWLLHCLDLDWMNRLRFLPTNVNNFTAGIPGAVFAADSSVWLSDAGEINNLPFTPILDPEKREGVARNINVIIVCDASSDSGSGDREMVVARNQIYRLGLWGSIPELRHCKFVNDNLIIFKDEDRPYVPTIIYFSLPLSAHQPTLKFDYTSDQFDNVCNTMHDLVVANKQTIVKEINYKALHFAPI